MAFGLNMSTLTNLRFYKRSAIMLHLLRAIELICTYKDCNVHKIYACYENRSVGILKVCDNRAHTVDIFSFPFL